MGGGPLDGAEVLREIRQEHANGTLTSSAPSTRPAPQRHAPTLSDADVRVAVGRRPELQFEGRPPDQDEVDSLQETIGDARGEILADLDREDDRQA